MNEQTKRNSGGSGGRIQYLPGIIEETARGKETMDLNSSLFFDRKVFLYGEITDEMADNVVKQMMHLAREPKPVNVYINSPGGSVNAGLVIYDVIQALKEKFPINMYCTGLAASMGAVILAGGQKGRRFILPHSTVMIHEPLIPGGVGGSATTIKKESDSIIKTKALINGILATHTGKSIKKIDSATSFDNFMNAEEAVEFGLCDEICNLFQEEKNEYKQSNKH